MGVRGVVRKSGELVKPCEKTPTGTLELSGMDKLPVLQCNARTLHVYREGSGSGSAYGVIKEALSKALVPYYPLAGRLSESRIECTAGGVWVVEATADCTLQELDYSEHYPELLPPQPSHHTLLQMQVTQFACAGFVIGLVFSHSVCDGLGAAQFLNAVGELARGLPRLSVEPVWCRDWFVSVSPMAMAMPMPSLPEYELVQANVEISTESMEKQKRVVMEQTGQRCSTFELVAAALWKCRSMAIGAEVKLVFFANCRQLVEPPLPRGFYGNCFFPVSVRGAVGGATLSQVVRLIHKAKADLPSAFADYRAGLLSDPFSEAPSYQTLLVSEWGRLGFNQVDLGWGPPSLVVPIQGSPLIPAAIVGCLPPPTRAITWCVQRRHRPHFIHSLSHLFNH